MTEITAGGVHKRLHYWPGNVSGDYVLTTEGEWKRLEVSKTTTPAKQPAAQVKPAEPMVSDAIPPTSRSHRVGVPLAVGGLGIMLLLGVVGAVTERPAADPAASSTVTTSSGLPLAAAELLGRIHGGGAIGRDLTFPSMTGNYVAHRGELVDLLGYWGEDRDSMAAALEWWLEQQA